MQSGVRLLRDAPRELFKDFVECGTLERKLVGGVCGFGVEHGSWHRLRRARHGLEERAVVEDGEKVEGLNRLTYMSHFSSE